MRNWRRFGFFVVGFLTILLGGFLVQKVLVPKGEISQKEPAVPEIRITLNDISLDEIKENGKDAKYLGNELAVGDLSFENVEIKGRGNATWSQVKRPYQIKLSQKADLLGLGERHKWILIASYWDSTNLRTDTAFYLANMVGEKFAHRGDFVELSVDGEYEGLYYLTRGIEIGKNAVDLRDPLGVLTELDNIYCKGEEIYFTTNNGECFTVKDAVTKDGLELAMADFMGSFNELEAAVRAKDYTRITEIADIESFAQYYLISEFVANPDAYFTSQYFYKDGPEDRIHAGPAWDFDIAFNNVLVRETFSANSDMTKGIAVEEFDNPELQYMQWSRLFARLIKIPEFEAEVKRVFRERMSGKKEELLAYIFRQAARIYPAAVRESEKWEKENYICSIKEFLEWVDVRYDYFEMEYGAKKHKKYPTYDINVIEV